MAPKNTTMPNTELFGILWFTVFGNTAIWLNDGEAAGTLGQMISSPETLLFKFLYVLVHKHRF